MEDFDAAFQHLLRWEGGYVNDPDDLGGETKYGITKRRYPNLDIANLTVANAEAIYRRDFYDKLRINLLPDHLQYGVFDGAVNQGPNWTIKTLQRLSGVDDDGIIGPKTANAARKVQPISFLAAREIRYRYIAGLRQNAKFLNGWLNRLESTAQVTYVGFGNAPVSAGGTRGGHLSNPGPDGQALYERTPSAWGPEEEAN